MSSRVIPPLLAAAVGIASGIYIWKEPLEQYKANTGGVPAPSSLPAAAGSDAPPASPPTAATPASAPAPAAAADVPRARGKTGLED